MTNKEIDDIYKKFRNNRWRRIKYAMDRHGKCETTLDSENLDLVTKYINKNKHQSFTVVVKSSFVMITPPVGCSPDKRVHIFEVSICRDFAGSFTF